MTQDVQAKVGNAIQDLLENQRPAVIGEFLLAVFEDLSKNPLHAGASRWAVRDSKDGVARTPYGVLVSSKELVMKVFLDTDENYSVSGYATRAGECFAGNIYLGLDKGKEYDRESTKVNEAIQCVTVLEAFELALRETRAVLAANPAAAIQEVSDKTLASLCKIWFDLPDAINVFEGGLRFDTQAPPRCPGDFTLPSGYIFIPDPPGAIASLGRAHGALLKQAVTQFVAQLRTSNRVPDGILSKAIFEAFPRGEDDLIARTIIGVLMGMLPTVDGNLTRAVKSWQKSGTFERLQQDLKRHGGLAPYVRASEVLKSPLKQAMQLDPVPDAVWRTAVKEHVLGTSNPVNVHPGDKIYVSIVSATNEDLHAGNTDVFPVFGGDRNTTPHPTHACPGYAMAIGVLLGIIDGFMEPT